MENKFVTIEYKDKSYVKDIKDVNDDEHISGVFCDVISACNVARKIARQFGLTYVPRKQVK